MTKNKKEKEIKKIKNFFKIHETIQVYFYPLYILIIYLMVQEKMLTPSLKYVTVNIFSRFNFLYFLLTVLSAGLIIYFLDKKFTGFFLTKKESIFYLLWGKLGYTLGKGDILGAILSIIIITRKLLNMKSEFTILLGFCLISSVFAGFFVNLIKPFLTRKRPSEELENMKIFQFKSAFEEKKFLKHKYLSMPSGHTTSIFATMLPLVLYFNNPLFFLTGIFIGTARVIAIKHWTSDVFLGAVLGSTIGFYFYEYFLQYIS